MALQHSNIADTWTPPSYGDMLDTTVQAKSVAFRASRPVSTDRVKMHFPLWTGNPTAGWYDELEEIALTDGATNEVIITPDKVAALSRVSNEAADDTHPAISEAIGAGISDDIAQKIDIAWLANTTAKANNGLLSIAYSTVDTGASLTNLDPFIDARFKANAVGAQLTSWVMHPDTANTLTKLKKLTSGSNEALLSFVDDGILIAGLPVLLSPHVGAATFAWGIPKQRVVTVIRKGTEVALSRDAGFSSDSAYIRGVARVGFGFLHPASVVRLYDAA